MFSKDLESCSDWPDVMDALDAMEEWSTPFMAQDDWLDVMEANYLAD